MSEAFTGACEALGISVQAAPPFAPTAKGIVERTSGSISTLFCQHLPGYTGSDVTRRGKDVAREACYSVAQLQDLLDEWLVHFHHRPHQGLRHPALPKVALSPNQMWAALVAVAGHVPVPLSGSDYLELLPVRWQTITEDGIRLHHRTYDHDLLGPYRRPALQISLKLEDLDVICVALNCEISDLLIPEPEKVRRPGEETGQQAAVAAGLAPVVVPRRRDGRSLPPT